ncbi:MAG: hypothetical protein KAT85_08445, partial [candidate division Zixibacteria bacterium]|nr:hypothetical protein [candidate division Zixibacteria bacterium]
MNLIVRHIGNQRGVSMIVVTIAIIVIFAFAVAAIDLSLIMLAKTQLQNAADAGAIAGALAFTLSEGDYGVAEAEAIRITGLNVAIQDSTQAPVVIGASDVTWPEADKIRVGTHRTLTAGDALTIYFLRVLDPVSDNLADVTARASAQVFSTTTSNCLKPWCVPDLWDDTDNDSVWDVGEFYDPYITGYRVPDHIGTQVTLKLANSNAYPRMGFFYAVDFAPINTGDPVITGADAYREWIATCEPYYVGVGDLLQIEPGNMVGPTDQGVAELIGADPLAEWDPVTGTVINSAYPVSPRVIIMAAFDPMLGAQTDVNGRDYLTVSKIMVMFLESHDNKEVTGRFIRKSADG